MALQIYGTSCNLLGIFILYLIFKYTIDGKKIDNTGGSDEARVTAEILQLKNFRHVKEILKTDETGRESDKTRARLAILANDNANYYIN